MHNYFKLGLNNYDEPDAFEYEKLEEDIVLWLNGKAVKNPIYEHKDRKYGDEYTEIRGDSSVLIVEGTMLINERNISNYLDTLIFLNVDNELRLIRKLRRDIKTRFDKIDKFTMDKYLGEHITNVRLGYLKYILPQRDNADIIIDQNYNIENLIDKMLI